MKRSLDDWRVELIRVTVFTRDEIPASGVEWWKQITGSEPDSISSKPQLRAFSVSGPLLDSQFVLNVGPGRIDWILGGIPTVDNPVPDIGTYVDTEKQFADLVSKWLANPPIAIVRLACGAIVHLPVADKIEGYRLLSELLPPLDIDAEGSSDLLYQINRPRTSTIIPALRVNRLSKWQVLLVSLVEAVAGRKTGIITLCRVELDMNTPAESNDNLSGHVGSLMPELFSLLREIVEKGDVK